MTTEDEMISRLRRWARADIWGSHGTQGVFLEDVANELERLQQRIENLEETIAENCHKS